MKGKDIHPKLLYSAKLSFRMEGQIKSFTDKVKLKEFIITKPLLYEMLKGLTYLKKRMMIKNTYSKMTTNSQLSTTEPKKKQKLSKQLEQEQNHRDGDHLEGYQWGWRVRMGERVQGIRSIIGRYKIDRGMLRIVWEMEKPKNLHV